ncbi:MAG TPA: 4Fe-4S dicluster domain-containing protein, partial [Prolixibacteraceae bacterium]|nr:4Fe-4S dicluster domain-containing protein [Prolixibacteraceae bacterium]
MDSLSINRAICKKCHLCVEVCPNKIYTTDSAGEVLIRADRIGLCFKCGQCMAICSTRSVVVDGLSYDTDFFELPDCIPDQDSFFNLIS